VPPRCHVNGSYQIAETVREFEDLVEGQYAEIYRDHPFLQPSDQVNWLRRMLENQDVRDALHLN
jgi:uncharacterized protein (DUF849 family)